MTTLFVNACVRAGSRTAALAEYLLSKWDGPVQRVDVGKIRFPRADEGFLAAREAQAASGDPDAPLLGLARQFAGADRIVVAAPLWDLSFPAALKQYFEQVNVVGVTFAYGPDGVPKGLCRAKELYYVTTAGGERVPEVYGYGYVKALAEGFYGIPDVRLIMAEGLDIDGADADRILRECMDRIDGEAEGSGTDEAP